MLLIFVFISSSGGKLPILRKLHKLKFLDTRYNGIRTGGTYILASSFVVLSFVLAREHYLSSSLQREAICGGQHLD